MGNDPPSYWALKRRDMGNLFEPIRGESAFTRARKDCLLAFASVEGRFKAGAQYRANLVVGETAWRKQAKPEYSYRIIDSKEAFETPLGVASDSPPGQSGQRWFFSRIDHLTTGR
jgi:hypothetical protein